MRRGAPKVFSLSLWERVGVRERSFSETYLFEFPRGFAALDNR
jgi:hypothetical protein